MEIKVNMKSMGKRKQTVKPVVYDLPLGAGNTFTVRQLVTELTRAGVEDYNRRHQEPEILKCLTKENIEDQAERGKISFGVIYGEKEADFQKAAGNAIQCFEDGIYRVFLDEKPLESLDEEVQVTKESTFTFVRLAMLTGRLW
ncbi:MAG: hypothetical protein HFG70_00035 [Hungatella sp.]|nr:hypothetical protein [Hungatella sp.]